MTKKKRITKKITKSALIRSMPHATAKQIVEEGKRLKLKFNERYVYAIRSNAKAKTKRTAPKKASQGADVATLRSLIAEIGLQRAREVLGEIQTAFGA